MKFSNLLKRPSAFIPLILSLAALALVLGHLALFGITHSADESIAARIFQLLILAEVPVVVVFAVRWLLCFPRAALQVLMLQAVAVLAALASVLILEP